MWENIMFFIVVANGESSPLFALFPYHIWFCFNYVLVCTIVRSKRSKSQVVTKIFASRGLPQPTKYCGQPVNSLLNFYNAFSSVIYICSCRVLFCNSQFYDEVFKCGVSDRCVAAGIQRSSFKYSRPKYVWMVLCRQCILSVTCVAGSIFCLI